MLFKQHLLKNARTSEKIEELRSAVAGGCGGGFYKGAGALISNENENETNEMKMKGFQFKL